MVDLYDMVAFADQYLNVGAIRDYGPQGLQVEGRREVGSIVTGVSACMPLFEEAARLGADAILVHHGMFWDNEPRTITASRKRRISYLLERDISLIGYHLPLDRHAEVGNNSQIIAALGLEKSAPFADYNGKSISFLATPPGGGGMAIAAFMEKVRGAINPAARHYAFGPGTVNKVAVCSGGAPELVREAVGVGADLYLTGEETEWIYHFAREEGIHYVAAGHHATERFGVRALGERLADEFGIAATFVDIDNPV